MSNADASDISAKIRRTPAKNWLMRVLFTAAGLIMIWLAGYGAFAYQVATMKPPSAALAAGQNKADAIIVLTGGSERINTGLDLLSEGKTHQLFISGVNQKVSLLQLLTLWQAERQPHKNKAGSGEQDSIAPCCVTLGHAATNTWENALEVRRWLGEHKDIKTIWVITSNFHMPRALMELRYAMPHRPITAYPVDSQVTMREFGGFIPTTLNEYNKTLLTWLRLHILSQDKKLPHKESTAL